VPVWLFHDSTNSATAPLCAFDTCATAAAAAAAGNLVRGGDQRGYNSLAKMYTIDYAMAGNTKPAA
jgi:hypothetical protein